MNFVHLVALLVSATLSTASIAPMSSASDLRAGGAAQELVNRAGNFDAAAFKFKTTTIADDGKDGAGGWQEAATKLEFNDARDGTLHTWTCSIEVGMPIRSQKGGTVSPDDAAEATASAANIASDLVMTRQTKWLPIAFCPEFGTELGKQLNGRPRIFGARVQRSQYP
jgi:hypothetical protein